MSITNTQLALDIANLVSQWQLRENEMINWLSGTVGGGPSSNGKYTLTDVNGVAVDVTCPAQLQADMNDLTTGASGYSGSALQSATNASISKDDAQTIYNNVVLLASQVSTDKALAETASLTAQTHEANSLAHYEAMTALYLGPHAAAPLVDNKGNTLQEGAIYWDTVLKALYVWNATNWVIF